MREIAAHGATCVGTMLMHLEGGTREHFLGVPADASIRTSMEGYGRLYAGKHRGPGLRTALPGRDVRPDGALRRQRRAPARRPAAPARRPPPGPRRRPRRAFASEADAARGPPTSFGL